MLISSISGRGGESSLFDLRGAMFPVLAVILEEREAEDVQVGFVPRFYILPNLNIENVSSPK